MINNNQGVNYSDQLTPGSQSSNKQPLTQVHSPQYLYHFNQISNGDSSNSKQIPQKAYPSRLDPSFKEKNKAMYNSSMNFGTNDGDTLSGLSLLGRKVHEPIIEKDQFLNFNTNDKHNYNLGLPTKDSKMASSAIFGLDNAAQNDMNRFPAFNLGPNLNYKTAEYSSATKNQINSQPKSKENAKQKRDRELLEMKKQLEDLSKKIKTVEQKNKTNDNNQSNSSNQQQKPSVTGQSHSYESIPVPSTSSSSNNNYNFSNKFQQYKNLPNTPNLNEQSYKNQQSSTTFNDQTYTQPKKSQQTYYNQTNYSTSQKQQASIQKPLYNYEPKYDQYEKKYENNSKNTGNNGSTSYDTYSSFKKDSVPKNQPNNYSSNNYAQNNYTNTNKANTDNVSYEYKPRSISTANSVPESKPYEYNYASSNSTSAATSVPSTSNQGVFKKKKNNVEVYENNSYKTDAFSKKANEDLKKPEYHPQTSTTTINSEKSRSIRKIQSFNYEDPNIPIKQLKKIKFSDFIIGKKMGKGMFGEVLLVKHKQTGWVCGLKVMQKRVIKQQNYMGQIARQLSIQFYLQHRNILSLYGYFEDEKNFYLLIEFCSGGQLLQRLKQQRRMNERDVALIIKQVCEGVDYIHKELIIHRDIKPENILFNNGIVKICDFGWAVYRGFGLRKTASGSPLYYPPEIVKGQEYDDKIDIWCIGMMAYECVMGKIPFKVYTQMDLKRIVSDEITFPEWVDVTDDFKDFILKTLKKNPDQRMEIRQMLRHPFLTKHQEGQLSKNILDDFKKVLG